MAKQPPEMTPQQQEVHDTLSMVFSCVDFRDDVGVKGIHDAFDLLRKALKGVPDLQEMAEFIAGREAFQNRSAEWIGGIFEAARSGQRLDIDAALASFGLQRRPTPDRRGSAGTGHNSVPTLAV